MEKKQIRVLLIVLRYDNYIPLIPIGTLYIANSLRKHNIDYRIIDLNFHSEEKRALLESISEYSPNYIGISIRNIAETAALEGIYDTIKRVVLISKKYAKVILGGAGFSLFPKTIMEYTKADFGIIGSGEKEIVKYIDACENGQSGANIAISNGVDEFVTSNISLEIIDYWKCYGKYHRLLQSEIPIHKIRGCGYSCAYCCYPALNSKKLQYRDIQLTIQEVDCIYNDINYNSFYFVDSTFNMDVAYSKEFLKEWYKKFQNKMSWRCCINPARCDDELLQLMKECGCKECEIGLDSCSDRVLTKMKKPYTKFEIIRVLSAIERVGLKYTVSLILGGEGETVESIRETITCLEQFNPHSVTVFIGVRIYPLTSYCKKMKREEKQLLYANRNSIYIEQGAVLEIQRLIQKPPKRWKMITI